MSGDQQDHDDYHAEHPIDLDERDEKIAALEAEVERLRKFEMMYRSVGDGIYELKESTDEQHQQKDH